MNALLTETVSLSNLDDFAQKICPLIIKHKTILFYGDVGAGKTTLIKQLVSRLGSKDDVSSPTYALVNNYESNHGELYHYDLYRLKSTNEVLDIDILDIIDQEFICFIEWPQLVESFIGDFLKIEIEKINEKERIFRIFKN